MTSRTWKGEEGQANGIYKIYLLSIIYLFCL